MIPAALREFFGRFPDTEGEQAVIRLVLVPPMGLLYMQFVPAYDGVWPIDRPFIYGILALYAVMAAAILAALLINPKPSIPRRVVAVVTDTLAVTASMLALHQYGIAIFGFYIWTCLGHGLRYGRLFLHLAQSMTILGFVVVLLFDPYWREHLPIGIGMLLTMFYLPPLAALMLERVKKARALAEEANEAKSRFLANISDEIRTPLNGIIGLTDLLKKSPLNAEQSQWMRSLSGSAEVLLSLVDNVLDIARIEAGKLTIEEKPFRVSELLSHLNDLFVQGAQSKGLHLVVEQHAPELDWVVGDRHHLSQVLSNLIANGIKFTDRGSVTVGVRCLAARQDAIDLKFEVADTGIGMSPEVAGRIFDSFTQADDSTRKRFGGSGLGTTIAKQLVERMGGEMGVQSTLGRGSTFWFRIGFRTTNAASKEVPRTAIEAMARSDGAAYGSTGEASRREPASASVVEIGRVLVVEDNATNRMVASTILQQAGYTVALAESGEAALLHLACEAYDLVLLDMTMPGMSGVDLLTRLRAPGADFGRVPCVMLTANATPQSRQLCEAAGADAFLTKPVNAEALVQTVRSIARTDSAMAAEVPRRGVLDVEKLKQHLTLGGDAFLRDLMDGYQSDGERSVVELQRAVDKGEEGQVRAHLHAMEGSAAEVGATEVMAACSALRVALQAEDPSSWAAELAHLRTAFAATCALLDRIRELGLVHREEPGLTEGTDGALAARAFPGEEPSGAVAP